MTLHKIHPELTELDGACNEVIQRKPAEVPYKAKEILV